MKTRTANALCQRNLKVRREKHDQGSRKEIRRFVGVVWTFRGCGFVDEALLDST